eukprot:comp18058_c0_seq1/m.18616 comp18058_c0_seq1/g.18616  ORF comp18058_c0_seq1/g.18616 comp18058_c0_seq1/m.18616 type:complete len:750 (-) comp18058_c0_seq1:231-2480(-)
MAAAAAAMRVGLFENVELCDQKTTKIEVAAAINDISSDDDASKKSAFSWVNKKFWVGAKKPRAHSKGKSDSESVALATQPAGTLHAYTSAQKPESNITAPETDLKELSLSASKFGDAVVSALGKFQSEKSTNTPDNKRVKGPHTFMSLFSKESPNAASPTGLFPNPHISQTQSLHEPSYVQAAERATFDNLPDIQFSRHDSNQQTQANGSNFASSSNDERCSSLQSGDTNSAHSLPRQRVTSSNSLERASNGRLATRGTALAAAALNGPGSGHVRSASTGMSNDCSRRGSRGSLTNPFQRSHSVAGGDACQFVGSPLAGHNVTHSSATTLESHTTQHARSENIGTPRRQSLSVPDDGSRAQKGSKNPREGVESCPSSPLMSTGQPYSRPGGMRNSPDMGRRLNTIQGPASQRRCKTPTSMIRLGFLAASLPDLSASSNTISRSNSDNGASVGQGDAASMSFAQGSEISMDTTAGGLPKHLVARPRASSRAQQQQRPPVVGSIGADVGVSKRQGKLASPAVNQNGLASPSPYNGSPAAPISSPDALFGVPSCPNLTGGGEPLFSTSSSSSLTGMRRSGSPPGSGFPSMTTSFFSYSAPEMIGEVSVRTQAKRCSSPFVRRKSSIMLQGSLPDVLIPMVPADMHSCPMPEDDEGENCHRLNALAHGLVELGVDELMSVKGALEKAILSQSMDLEDALKERELLRGLLKESRAWVELSKTTSFQENEEMGEVNGVVGVAVQDRPVSLVSVEL